ncbi:MAG: arsenate reductase ArsC [Deltaproteobacteria bacterium]|nr:arsenate reductase ArsC [Deltaproteobacteria bacterium]
MTNQHSEKIRVLFICVHNSGRSQMAEAFLNTLAGDRFQAESAGFDPTRIYPLVIKAMQEIGMDLSKKQTQSVFKLYQEGKLFDYVITVCEESAEDQCPMFPGVTRRLNWPFDNPEAFEGSHEEKLNHVKRVRDEVRARIESWVQQSDRGEESVG